MMQQSITVKHPLLMRLLPAALCVALPVLLHSPALAQSSGPALAMPIAAALVAPAVGLFLAIFAWRLASRLFSFATGLATAVLVLALLLAAEGRFDLSSTIAGLPAPFGTGTADKPPPKP